MQTIENNIETVLMPQAMALDIAASNGATTRIYLDKEPEKNARGPMQITRARKSQLLIVDEEWW